MGHPYPPPHGQPRPGPQGPPPPGFTGPPGPPPHPPGPPHAAHLAAPPPRPPRTLAAIALTASGTLAVAGILTWTVVFAYGSGGVSSAGGLPTDDPCAVLAEETLTDLDAEVSSWNTSPYSNGCSWTVSLDGDETTLHFERMVPLSEEDAALEEERGEEEVPRDADGLYRSALESAAGGDYAVDSEASLSTDTRSLSYGDESTLTMLDTAYEYSDGRSQYVSLTVREEGLVSVLSFLVGTEFEDIDLAEAERLLTPVADDVFG